MITFALLMYGPVPIIEIASDPKSDPEPEKQGRNKEGQPLGFGSFQVSKSLETLEVQQMDKPTAAHNPEAGGSSPPPATNKPLKSYDFSGFLHFSSLFCLVYFFVWSLTHTLTHVGTSSGSLPSPPAARLAPSAAPPFQMRPAALGSHLGYLPPSTPAMVCAAWR